MDRLARRIGGNRDGGHVGLSTRQLKLGLVRSRVGIQRPAIFDVVTVAVARSRGEADAGASFHLLFQRPADVLAVDEDHGRMVRFRGGFYAPVEPRLEGVGELRPPAPDAGPRVGLAIDEIRHVARSSINPTLLMSGTFEQPTPWSTQRTT